MKEHQKITILRHLRSKPITGKWAMDVYGIYRLSDVIRKLRLDGHDIMTTMHKMPDGRRYGKYTLIKEKT